LAAAIKYKLIFILCFPINITARASRKSSPITIWKPSRNSGIPQPLPIIYKTGASGKPRRENSARPGQWEVRNKYFQGCIGKTAPTFTPGNARRLLVFSSYFDYLSFLHENETSDSVLVINSLLCPSLELAVHYPHIQLYLEREPTRAFLKALPYATDHSTAFVGFRNYNEKRKAEARAERQAEERPRKDFMAGIEVPFSR
jgi:hypothetical protein